MKAFTDLKQSKKLKKILPLESADMYYLYDYDFDTLENIPTILEEEPKGHFIVFAKDIPCWSLAALLEQLPEIINYEDDESDYALEISKENDLYYLSYGNPFEHGKLEVEPQENFVDACYEMIIKLHEQKLL